MCVHFCIGLFDFLLKDKRLLDYLNLFSPSKYEKDNKTTLKYFWWLKKLRMKRSSVLFAVSIENPKTLRNLRWKKYIVLSVKNKKKIKNPEIYIFFMKH